MAKEGQRSFSDPAWSAWSSHLTDPALKLRQDDQEKKKPATGTVQDSFILLVDLEQKRRRQNDMLSKYTSLVTLPTLDHNGLLMIRDM